MDNIMVPTDLNQLREKLEAGYVYTAGGYSLLIQEDRRDGIIVLRGKDITETGFRNIGIAVCTLLNLIGRFTEQEATSNNTITVRDFFEPEEISHPGKLAYYKDCYISDYTRISNNYCILSLGMPLPRGGYIDEIVSMDAPLELK